MTVFDDARINKSIGESSRLHVNEISLFFLYFIEAETFN